VETKICNKCKEEQPITAFHMTGIGEKRRKTCKICRNNEKRVNRQHNPEQHRGYELKRRYKITVYQFNLILTLQNKRCALCGSIEPGGQGTWHVDHDHNCCLGATSCGKCIRGLLCTNCNSVLGFAKDNKLILKKAIKYLEKEPINVKSITRINRVTTTT
jgi:hypothetical protein